MVRTMPDSSSTPPAPYLKASSVADLHQALDTATAAHRGPSEAIDAAGARTHEQLEQARAAAGSVPLGEAIEDEHRANRPAAGPVG